MQFKLPERLPPRLVTLLAIVGVAGLTITFAVTDDDGDGRPDRATVTVRPIDPGPPITAPAAQVERAADAAEDAHGKLDHEHEGKGEPLTDEQIDRNQDLVDRTGINGLSPTLAGGATFNQRGCRSLPLNRNYSLRNPLIKPPLSGPAHITVSPEIRGWGDIIGLRDYFNRPSTGASAHYLIDGEGHCAQILDEALKGWTAGNMNPYGACQIEMIGMPDANGWHQPAGLAKAALVLRDCSKRWGIPIQVGNTSGCSVIKPGLVDHNELECNNDHWDICRTAEKARTSGSDPCPLVAQIVQAMRRGGMTSRLTTYERRIVRERCGARAAVIAAPRGSASRGARVAKSRVSRRVVRSQTRRIDHARRADGKPWRYRHRGARRHELARAWTGKGC